MYIQVITERGREGTETLSNEKSCTEEDVIVALSVGFMRLPSQRQPSQEQQPSLGQQPSWRQQQSSIKKKKNCRLAQLIPYPAVLKRIQLAFLVGAFKPALAVVDLRAAEVFGAAFLAPAALAAVFFVAIFLGAAAFYKVYSHVRLPCPKTQRNPLIFQILP